MKDAAFTRLCAISLVADLPALSWLDLGALEWRAMCDAARRARFS